MNKQPEQTARTKKKIIDSFWRLAKDNGLANVTISAITKNAALNRSTFYVYFEDIDDLLEQVETEIIHNIQKEMKKAVKEGGIEDYQTISEKMISLFTQYDDKLFLLIGKNGDPHFLSWFREQTSHFVPQLFPPVNDNPYKEYIIAFTTSAVTGILTYWHDTGRMISMKELSKLIHGMLTKGVWGNAEIISLKSQMGTSSLTHTD